MKTESRDSCKVFKWVLVRKFKGGHKLFHAVDDGRFAIADNSGSKPHLTDDGILWLDPKREIYYSRKDKTFSIPLKDITGEEKSTICDFEEAQFISNYLFKTILIKD